MEYIDLVESIRDNLAQYQYTEHPEALSIGSTEGVVLAAPRRMMVRYLCGVFDLPEGCDTRDEARVFFETLRRSLTARYARFPYWKALGTYVVFTCGSRLFDAIERTTTKFSDRTGLHMNVMLGTVFLDREEFLSSAESTWGLFYSGRHFGAISATVNEWCKRRRSEQAHAADEASPRR
jgi:hypothetical protein